MQKKNVLMFRGFGCADLPVILILSVYTNFLILKFGQKKILHLE